MVREARGTFRILRAIHEPKTKLRRAAPPARLGGAVAPATLHTEARARITPEVRASTRCSALAKVAHCASSCPQAAADARLRSDALDLSHSSPKARVWRCGAS
eukprot:1460032-Prymnesium_polylepis.1